MNKVKQQWHTYENKQDRQIRIMVKDASNMWYQKKLKLNSSRKGFKILKAKILKIIKENSQYKYIKLQLFMLTFDKFKDIKKIHEIHEPPNMKVRTVKCIYLETVNENNLNCKHKLTFYNTTYLYWKTWDFTPANFNLTT